MGQDKALLPHRGLPLACWIAEEVRAACGSATLVGDTRIYAGLGLPVVPDTRIGVGPLAGLEAALSTTTAEWNLIVACDLPGVSRELFSTLLEAAGAAEKDALIPRHADGFVEPLCAVYHSRVLPFVRTAIDSKCFKMQDMIASLDVAWWLAPEPGPFENVNTPEEWRNLQKVHG
jgi:molybdopterin-guanine dinucleotide biosynthesis protein A